MSRLPLVRRPSPDRALRFFEEGVYLPQARSVMLSSVLLIVAGIVLLARSGAELRISLPGKVSEANRVAGPSGMEFQLDKLTRPSYEFLIGGSGSNKWLRGGRDVELLNDLEEILDPRHRRSGFQFWEEWVHRVVEPLDRLPALVEAVGKNQQWMNSPDTQGNLANFFRELGRWPGSGGVPAEASLLEAIAKIERVEEFLRNAIAPNLSIQATENLNLFQFRARSGQSAELRTAVIEYGRRVDEIPEEIRSFAVWAARLVRLSRTAQGLFGSDAVRGSGFTPEELEGFRELSVGGKIERGARTLQAMIDAKDGLSEILAREEFVSAAERLEASPLEIEERGRFVILRVWELGLLLLIFGGPTLLGLIDLRVAAAGLYRLRTLIGSPGGH